MKVFIGFDPNEAAAYGTAWSSITRLDRRQEVDAVNLTRLRNTGLYTRPTEDRNGQLWDVVSGAPMSSEFSISRFFVPFLTTASDEWALFVDSDIVSLSPVVNVLKEADPRFAVQVVQHALPYTGATTKKVNKLNLSYPRKNWSSVVLWNLRHPAHRELTLDVLNNVPGRDLHRFCWLEDEQIGSLSTGWNWLVNVQPRPDPTHIAHFTLGGPWLKDWKAAPNDDLWTEAWQGWR